MNNTIYNGSNYTHTHEFNSCGENSRNEWLQCKVCRSLLGMGVRMSLTAQDMFTQEWCAQSAMYEPVSLGVSRR